VGVWVVGWLDVSVIEINVLNSFSRLENAAMTSSSGREIHKLRLNVVDLTRNTQFISSEINH
jgi:hypothetical protein